MASLTESVKFMEEYLTKRSSDTAKLVSGIGLNDKAQPDGAARNATTNQTVLQVRNTLATNPIVQMGVDTANQMATGVAQGLVTAAFKKINFAPIQNASQNFFQSLASLSTGNVEVAMELARNTGRNIVKKLNQKDGYITEIQAELIALHNACAIILNSSPFLDQYIRDLIRAYQFLIQGETKFKNVVRVLNQGINAPAGTPARLSNVIRFRKLEFQEAIRDLENAQELILPDQGADVSSIRGVQDFVSTTLARQTNLQAKAAVIAIPGITLKLGKLMIDYTKTVVEINLLLNTFVDALDAYIESYQRGNNIDTVTRDHIEAGLAQLTSLLNDMNAALFPDLTVTPDFDPTQLSYGPRLTARATGWGVKLQSIIEWMKLNPGAGSAQLDQTSNSVFQYTRAKNSINGFGDLTYPGGTMKITAGREDIEVPVGLIAKLMLRVNTIIATRQTRVQITNEFRTVQRYFETSLSHSNRLRTAIQPFLNTQSTLTGIAKKVLSQALGVANKFGLDRVVGLINDGKIRDLFSVTPDTATLSGAAVVGVNNLLSAIRGQPNVTDTQVQRLEGIRDTVQREKTAKEIEANRSYSTTLNAAQEELKKKLADIKATIFPAIETAKTLDADAGDPAVKAENTISNAIPGFNANRELAGL